MLWWFYSALTRTLSLTSLPLNSLQARLRQIFKRIAAMALLMPPDAVSIGLACIDTLCSSTSTAWQDSQHHKFDRCTCCERPWRMPGTKRLWIMNNHDGSLEKTNNIWRTSAQAWLWRTFFRLPATWFERHLLKNTYLRLHERSLRQYLCSIQSPVALLCWRAIKGTSAQLHSALWHARGCASQPKSAHT